MVDAERAGPPLPQPGRVRPSAGHGPACLSFVSLIAVAALGASLLMRPRPLLVWNASASSPTGLYLVSRGARPKSGETVVAWAPAHARRLASERDYLPFDVPLVKRVAAVAGDRVCAVRDMIFVDGRAAARRRRIDPRGRPMPWWRGCHMLAAGELFLLSAGKPRAFDGRYFGVTAPAEVIGKAVLLWSL